MYRSELWVTEKSHVRTTNRNLRLRVTCATSACEADDFAGGTITSFGEDADKNAILLATDGVYLVVEPTLCNKAQPPRSTKKLLIGLGCAIVAAASGLGLSLYIN